MSSINWQLLGEPRPRKGENPQIKWWQRLLSGGMAALAVAGFQALGMLRSTEEIAYRALFTLRGPQSWHERVVIIAIDEASTEDLDRRSWSREQYAKLLNVLTPAQPTVVVLDILMSNSSPADKQLAASMQVPVVMLMAWDKRGDILLPTPELRQESIATGHVVKYQDSTDGITRKIKAQVDGFLALALESYKADSLSQDSRKLPDLDRPLWVNWPGPVREITQYSFTDVITRRVDARVFQDKIVLVGTTVRGFNPLQTPFDMNPPASCIHLQAAVISNLLQQNYLRPIGWYNSLTLLLLLSGPVLSLLMASWGLKKQAMAGLALCSGWAILSFGFFEAAYIIPVGQPIALFSLTTLAVALQERLSMKARLKLREKQLWQQVFYDRVTGLPNRNFSIERLSQEIALAQLQADYQFAVLFVDLDRFKAINAQYGHALGDRLLAASAGKLEACLGELSQVQKDCTLAHFGADKFIILLHNLLSLDDPIAVAKQIYQAFDAAFIIEGKKIFCTVSIGIVCSQASSLCNNDESEYKLYEQPEMMLRDAEIAMYQARVKGQAFYAVFDRDLHDQYRQRLELERDLRRAVGAIDNPQGLSEIIDAGTKFALTFDPLHGASEFCLYYQPIISLETGLITGFEALVRWQHPQRGMVSPVEFIPLAEKTGLIATLGKWILREACYQLQFWRSMFQSNLPAMMVVNLSPIQLRQLELREQINAILEEMELDSSCLKLEITESSLMENSEAATTMLQEIRATGIKFSLDDFGTGYSSLGRLQDMPIDTLKIDRSFIMRTNGEDESWEIVKTIINLAHNLGMNVVAEGIETPEHLAQLRRWQCDYGQGYFFSKPIDAASATALLAENHQW